MDSLQEYIGLANELRTQFAAGDDAASVASVVAARAQLDAAVAAREGGAASAIERLVAQLAHEEAASARPEPEDEHARRVADLEAQASAAKENTAEMQAKLADLTARRSQTAAAAAGLADIEKVTDHVKTVLLKRAAHEVSLYLYLTHLHWNDMDAVSKAAMVAAAAPGADPARPAIPAPEPGRVRATIADPQVTRQSSSADRSGFGGGGMAPPRHDMYPVDLDTRGLTPVQVADRLWALIEEKTL